MVKFTTQIVHVIVDFRTQITLVNVEFTIQITMGIVGYTSLINPQFFTDFRTIRSFNLAPKLWQTRCQQSHRNIAVRVCNDYTLKRFFHIPEQQLPKLIHPALSLYQESDDNVINKYPQVAFKCVRIA